MSYSDRLAILDIELLEIRRIKSDLIMCFKILHNLTCLDVNNYFIYDCRDLCVRGYDDKRLVQPATITNLGVNNFFNRSVRYWNSLSYESRATSSLNVFKTLLNSHDFSQFLKGMCKCILYFTCMSAYRFLTCILCLYYNYTCMK